MKNVDLAELPKIMAALERHKTSAQWAEDGGKYIPHPATWLNQHRWTDELDGGGFDPGAIT